MRALVSASLIALLFAPTAGHAEGKPRVMGYTRKALKAAFVPRLSNMAMLSPRVRASAKMGRFMSDPTTAEVQLTGTPGNGFVALLSSKKAYYPGQAIILSQRPVGPAAFYALPLPTAAK